MRSVSAGGVILALALAFAPAADGQAADAPAAGYASKAVDAANQIADVPRRLAVYREMLPALGRARDRASVGRVAEAGLKLARERSDRVARAEVAAAAAVAFALAGDREGHERWTYEAIDAGAFADRRVAWTAIARARLDGGDVDGAGQVAASLTTAAERAGCFAELALASATLEPGEAREACMDFLRMAIANARAAERPASTQEAIARAQAALGTGGGAEQSAAAIAPGFHRARAMAEVARAAARAGEAARYELLAKDAADSAMKGLTVDERAGGLLAVARIRAELDDRAGAMAALKLVDEATKGVEEGRLAGVLLATAGVRARSGDAAGAQEATRRASELFKGVRASLAADDAVASLSKSA